MKKTILALVVALAMCFSLAACGGNTAPESDAAPEAAPANEVSFDEGTVLLENEYAKVELVKFFEEEVNWADKEPAIEKNITLKVTNLSDVEFLFGFGETYIGDEGGSMIMMDGNAGPLPGKSNVYSYRVQREGSPDGVALESLDELYLLNGQIEIDVYSADGEYIEDTIEEMFDLAEFK